MISISGWVLLAVVGMTSVQQADADPAAMVATTKKAPPQHAIFVELLGKGGMWGLGYSGQLHERIAVGAVGSFSKLDDQRMYSFSPSVTVYPIGVHRHRWFVDLGPQLVHLSTPSPVPEWMGVSETGLGGQMSTGYEHRGALFVRVFVMGVAGKRGTAPWFGADLGWAF